METEHIHKIVGTESMLSRLPANIPPSNSALICTFYDGFNGDFGMIPSVVEIPSAYSESISDYTCTEINIPVSDNKYDDEFYPMDNYSQWYIEEQSYLFSETHKYDKCFYIKSVNVLDSSGNVDHTRYGIFEHSNYDKEDLSGDFERKFLSYNEIHKWHIWYLNYISAYLSDNHSVGEKVYDTALEHYNHDKANGAIPLFSENDAVEQDNILVSRGGHTFMKWMEKNCIGLYMVDLGESHVLKTYENIPKWLYYPQLRMFKTWYETRYPLYSGMVWSDCASFDDCCDCKYYFEHGGKDMYIWLESQSAPDSVSSCCITSNISLPIFIHRKIEDLGEMSPAIETWSADENYHSELYSGGTMAVYDEDAYVLSGASNSGFNYSSYYHEKLWGNLDPNSWHNSLSGYGYYSEYSDNSKDQWINSLDLSIKSAYTKNVFMQRLTGPEFISYTGTVSGYTTSKLSTLMDKVITTDSVGNKMPGQLPLSAYLSSSTISFPVPKEKEEMDLLYHAGNVYELEKEKDLSVSGDIKETLYWGDILTSIRFFLRDMDGNEIPLVSGDTSLFEGNSDGNLVAIHQCENEIKNNYGLEVTDKNFVSCIAENVISDGKIYFSISYSIGTLIKNTYNSANTIINYYEKYEDHNYPVGVDYVETGYVHRDEVFFVTNDGTSVMLYFYNTAFDNIQNVESNGLTANEQTAYFVVKPSNSKENSYNGFVGIPLLRKEDMILNSFHKKYNSDIYISRGNQHSIDRNLILQEVRSLEDLEQYGNGYLNISQ